MRSKMEAVLSSLQPRGTTRRLALILTVIFFGVLYVEVYVGHLPVLDRHVINGSAIPIAAFPLALATLGVAQLVPNRYSQLALESAMGLSVVVGVAGFLFHLNNNGVRLDHLVPMAYIDTWSGRESPVWPLSISLAALVGLWAGWGLARDRGFMTAGLRPVGAFVWLYVAAGVLFYAGLIMVNVQTVKGVGLVTFLVAVLGYVALMGADLASALGSRTMAEKEIAT
jgi:hypothetical protein